MVPTDIVDHVLGVLHSEKDYSTLETCSLVFPQFVDRHLYSQITLDVAEEGLVFDKYHPTAYYVVDSTKFSRMLIDYPRVANYVRVVQIVIEVDTQLDLSTNQQLGDLLSSTSSILETLPHPEMIMVSVRGREIPWHMLGSNFCSAFRNSIQLPSIISIAISNINDFPLDYFDNCKNLKDLHLGGLFTHGEAVSTSPYPRLRSLHVDSDRDSARMVSWMKSNTLHTLSLCPHSGSGLSDFQTLIKACSTTLVNLDIDYNFTYPRYGLLPIAFPNIQLPFLDHLTFRFRPCSGISPLSILFASLRPILSLLSPSPIRLTLHFLLCHRNVDWSTITPLLLLPIFRHPIELYFTQHCGFFDLPSSVENNADVKRLREDGTLVAFLNE